jgi:hypothetical protein
MGIMKLWIKNLISFMLKNWMKKYCTKMGMLKKYL